MAGSVVAHHSGSMTTSTSAHVPRNSCRPGTAPPDTAPPDTAPPDAPVAAHVSVGRAGEELIADLLQRSGWRILDRNWRPAVGPGAPRGELDVVAERQGTVTVFEVKTRSGGDFGHPAEAVGWAVVAASLA